MSDLAALATAWAGLSAGPTLKKLTALNATMVAGPPQDVRFDAIQPYLIDHGLLDALNAYVSAPGKAKVPQAFVAANYLLALLGDGARDRFMTSQPDVLAEVQAFLKALTADPGSGIDSDHAAALMAMTGTTVPWWQANGFDKPIGVSDLIAAGNLF